MAKNYLVIKDNVIEKYLLLKTKEMIGQGFYNSAREINDIYDEVIEFYAE